MRWSGVRVLFQATILSPLRLIPYRVFLFLDTPIFLPKWHTLGTLEHNKTPKHTNLGIISQIQHAHTFKHSKKYQTLFQSVKSVPSIIKFSILHRKNDFITS